jgi:hypothetical protein
MEFIENNFELLKMYKYQKEEKNSKEYQEYLKYLEIYFSKNNKKDNLYKKEYVDGNYILINEKNPENKIIISSSKFINIHELYIKLKEYSEEIMYKIINLIETKNNITEENRKEFDNIKNKYILCLKNLNDIEILNKEFLNETELLYNQRLEKSYDLAKYFRIRKNNYIKFNMNENVKNKLIKRFKENNNKIPSNIIINKIAKEFNSSSSEIESLFKWIESSYFYLLVKDELNKINVEIKEKEDNFDQITKYMIIKKPNVQK